MDFQTQIDEINAKLDRVNQVTFLDPISDAIIQRKIVQNVSEGIAIGGIYTSVDSVNPGTSLGYGTWTAFGTGRTLVGIDTGDTDFDVVEETGGVKTHTLTTAEIPSHTHPTLTGQSTDGAAVIGSSAGGSNIYTLATSATGGGTAHTNVQPYIVVYMWKRTA